MNLGIMQPYFIPYIGYWQLMAAVDEYVIYDNIQYTKKGWINRNRILQNGSDTYITLPLKKDSDYLDVVDRYISDTFDRKKLLNQIFSNYKKAPFFEETYELITDVVNYEENNLFRFIYNSIIMIKKHLDINTELIISSTLPVDHSLKGQDKVIDICKKLHATEYYNAIGGMELYSKEKFNKHSCLKHSVCILLQ